MSHCIKGYLTWLDLTWLTLICVSWSRVVLQLTSGACSWSVCNVVDGALCCLDGAGSDEDEWSPVRALSALQRSSHPVCSILTRVQLADVLSQCHQLVSMSVSPFYTVILFTLLLVHLILRISPHHSHHLHSHHLSFASFFQSTLYTHL